MSEDYKNGKLNGSTKTYYDNGKLYEHKIWNEGVQDGPMKQYYLDGSVKFEEFQLRYKKWNPKIILSNEKYI